MGDENRFFRLLWRFNAIVLAAAGIGAVILLGVASFNALFWRNNWDPVPTGGFAPVPGKAQGAFTYRLEGGSLATVGRENILALRRWAGAPEEYGLQHDYALQSMGSTASVNTVNLLAIDDAGKSHWLFRGHERLINSHQTVKLAADALTPPFALVMRIVDADTNKDGALSDKDRKSVYIYRSGDAMARRLLTADEIRLTEQSGTDRYVIVSETGKTATVATYALPDFRLLGTQPVPNVPQ